MVSTVDSWGINLDIMENKTQRSENLNETIPTDEARTRVKASPVSVVGATVILPRLRAKVSVVRPMVIQSIGHGIAAASLLS